jgi:hypothetical protein
MMTIGFTTGSGAAFSVAQAFVSSCAIAYGFGCASTRPGTSTRVELCTDHSSSGSQPCGTRKAVPRRSRMLLMFSPAAMRRVTSTSARSALPKMSRSAFDSNSTERRTLSDQ